MQREGERGEKERREREREREILPFSLSCVFVECLFLRAPAVTVQREGERGEKEGGERGERERVGGKEGGKDVCGRGRVGGGAVKESVYVRESVQERKTNRSATESLNQRNITF